MLAAKPFTGQPMTNDERQALLQLLESRFTRHIARHPALDWADVHAALMRQPALLDILQQMESTGGEPDVVALHEGLLTFCDCSAESPIGRRSLCYDGQARKLRKEAAPVSSAMEMAAAMGIELMTETEYHALQQYGAFDTKTSSWLATPAELRALGGALFGDRRYNRVFIYHNGVQSYYAARGFRGLLRVS
jgi:hypothetical protein